MENDNCCNPCCCDCQWIKNFIKREVFIATAGGGTKNNGKLLGTQAESRNNIQILLDDNQTIPFDTMLNNQNPNVSFNPTTGVFTVTKAGNYAVVWFANINGTGGGTTVKISCNGTEVTAEGSVQAQISGIATLTLNAGDTISLKNTSGFQVRLDGGNVQAGIQILSV